MGKRYFLAVALLMGAAWPGPVSANPTGAGLLSYPVEPCRFLDTRVSRGPIASYAAMDVFVRGSVLDSADGALQTDCGVPASAEAVKVNITAVSPGSSGYLKINGTGFVGGPMGAYNRLTFKAGNAVSNELEVSLCNVYVSPAAQQACLYDDLGRYLDFQVLNMSAGTVEVVGDVVGYLARP